MSHDRWAHLRANLARHREVTAARAAIAWCRECEVHHADDSGLCPVCRPVEVVQLPAPRSYDDAA